MPAARPASHLFVLIDVALNQSDANRLAGVRPLGHRRAMAAPHRHADHDREDDGERRGSSDVSGCSGTRRASHGLQGREIASAALTDATSIDTP